MADMSTTASYVAAPKDDADGVPMCAPACPAYAVVRSGGSALDPYYGGGGASQPAEVHVCCITRTNAGGQCRPVLLARLRPKPKEVSAVEMATRQILEALGSMRLAAMNVRDAGDRARAAAIDDIREQLERTSRPALKPTDAPP